MIKIIRACFFLLCFIIIKLSASAQVVDGKPDANAMLWKISGNGLTKPSYIFGTIHIICKEEASKVLTPSLKQAMQSCTEVLFEINKANVAEQIVASQMYSKMRHDTTLSQLVTKRQLKTIKRYFVEKKVRIPWEEAQTLKPVILQSEIGTDFLNCTERTSIENELTEMAKISKIKIGGISSAKEQLSFNDSIPYKDQAKSVLNAIADTEHPDKNRFYKIMDLYLSQQMVALDSIFKPDVPSRSNYIFLVLRNNLWTTRLIEKMKTDQVFLAVGCAHLFGKEGLVPLLRRRGYTVEGVPNKP
ncbi:TraB/GumN family protein [Pedobacter borealis]|uniref:TraB/GumN family protein n=1 Tax=Pedobacter borealis TaxID=475254 RepID=UPI00049311C2|nr:TraB/GumN family protein [Pedobacter borealis]